MRFVVGVAAVLIVGAQAAAATLSLDDRIAARRSVEEVLWRHRIWPAENAEPKPPLSVVLPDAEIRARVIDDLRKSEALDVLWHRPVTATALQAEIDRMRAASHAPEVLQEMFAAVGNDPVLEMEAIARPALVDRLIRSWYEAEAKPESFDSFWRSSAASFPLDEQPLAAASAPAPRALDAASCTDGSWHPLGNVSPSARSAHTAVWTGSEMIVWGGMTAGGAVNSGSRYDPATDSWYPMSSVGAPSARERHDAVWTGTEMIVWGGQQLENNPWNLLGDGARYNPVSDTWAPMTNTGAPSARREATLVWTGSRAIVFGGQDATVYLNTGGMYDPLSDSWTATSTTGAPGVRGSHTALWTGSRMIVWGGFDDFGDLETGGRFDPVANSWQPTSMTNVPAGRKNHTAVWTGSRMIVWGGYESLLGHTFDDGSSYDPVTDAWTQISHVGMPDERQEHTAVWTGSLMIVWGGSTTNGDERFDGGRYDPASNTWASMSWTPNARHLHTAVWTGAEMIVWGGVADPPGSGTFYYDTGGRYAPSSDSWVPTSIKTTGPPSPREFHTAVFTGAETIFWGGAASNTGGRYTAATDTWAPTTTANAPQAREAHTAVWTGTEMIVWGGYDVSLHPITSGGRYNPSSDSWTTTSITNAPFAVAHHTAVWTGSRMIVWGGSGMGLLSRVGSRYDPATNSWSLTSLVGAPSARFLHTAVWTGSRMIVWGGSVTYGDSNDGVGDGALYDPVGDTWIPTASGPSGRVGHVAVWTGSSMIVWGGDSYGGRVGQGGRYRLSTNTWTPTTNTGAPGPRDGHTQTWGGGTMLVFGGDLAGVGATDTGASYCACVTVYRDSDGDGWGNPLDTSSSCDGILPAGYIERAGDCNDSIDYIHPGGNDNNCNAVDEDCSGTPDDQWIGGLSHCGLGVCRANGVFECVGGQIVNDCTPGTPTDSFDTSCNNLDDDCDGQTDEDFIQWPDLWSGMANGPQARTKQTAVWTGSDMIVFGGDNGSGTVKAGGETYSPSTNTWTSLPAGPTKRWRHTAVWGASRMIVWGGDDNVATVYNTGSRYDPSTQTWVATTTTGAPSARFLHTAVWTGSRMVIWGGRDATNTLNSGSRYDPSTNTWSATSTTGAPTARALHSAVWTGTEMIVWGGQGVTATGGRYDPVANTWTALPSVGGGFAARYGHVAVWTGSEMVLWGGTDGTSFFGNGRRYNPSTNSWTATSSSGAPSGRAFASAVWTGTEMIVWGGQDASGTLANGARYNPSTDTWAVITATNAPSDRAVASAVWTGSEMILWGGGPSGTARSDGGRYAPVTTCGTGGCQRTGHLVCSGGVQSYQCVPQAPTPEVCDGLDNDCNTLVDDGIAPPNGHPVLTLGRFTSPTNTLYSWTAVPGATGYDTIRGILSLLRATSGSYAQSIELCAFNDLTNTSFQDNAAPASGDAWWFLVRPVNCGGNGSYDDTVARDAGISASPAACP